MNVLSYIIGADLHADAEVTYTKVKSFLRELLKSANDGNTLFAGSNIKSSGTNGFRLEKYKYIKAKDVLIAIFESRIEISHESSKEVEPLSIPFIFLPEKFNFQCWINTVHREVEILNNTHSANTFIECYNNLKD